MDSSRIFIVGAKGQLGLALHAEYPDAQAADIDELDITDKKSVDTYDWSNVDIILNVAAFTNVDGAETPEGRLAAWKVNAVAVSYLAEVAWKNDITMLHISTDYVFDGIKKEHDEDEDYAPLSVYGASKAAGDIVVQGLPKYYILRTSWVIGEGKNFVRTMLGVGEKGIEPTVVSDQIGRLTFTNELVRAIKHVLETNAPFGTYNISNSGESLSWADYTRAIFKEAGFDLKVTDTTTEEYFKGKENIAPRPLYSTLNLSKIESIGFKTTDWRDDLKTYIESELAKTAKVQGESEERK